MRLGKLQEERTKKNPKNPENQQIRGRVAELRRELNQTNNILTSQPKHRRSSLNQKIWIQYELQH